MAGGPALGGTGKKYNGRMTFAVYFVVILGGCGGLLLGYDNGKILTSCAGFSSDIKDLQGSVNVRVYFVVWAFAHDAIMIINVPMLMLGMLLHRCHWRRHSYA